MSHLEIYRMYTYRDALSFRVEAVHHRNNCGIQHAKNDEGSPPDIVETDGGDLHDHKDEHPVPARRDSLHGRPNACGTNFRGVKPGNRKPAHAIDELEEEYEGCGAVTSCCRAER